MSVVTAYPVRIIPFDLGRSIKEPYRQQVIDQLSQRYTLKTLNQRQSAIFSDLLAAFSIDAHLEVYVYCNGIAVVVILEAPIDYEQNYKVFSIEYGKDRKRAHAQLFSWEHPDSAVIGKTIEQLRAIVQRTRGRKDKSVTRYSAGTDFENQGFSYVMTLSMFDVASEHLSDNVFKNYPGWLKSNIYALLDPSIVYLEDSSKMAVDNVDSIDLEKILLKYEEHDVPRDYERHQHLSTYMSWAAVILVGRLLDMDREEYIALEVQLQSDWYYVYCLDKNLDYFTRKDRYSIYELQKENYELELLQMRLYDFDDSSIPSRIIDVQGGLVETSSLNENIERLSRKLEHYIEIEKLNESSTQKRLSQSSELLLFMIAFIEIAPTVAEYASKVYPHLGLVCNIAILLIGLPLMIWKNK